MVFYSHLWVPSNINFAEFKVREPIVSREFAVNRSKIDTSRAPSSIKSDNPSNSRVSFKLILKTISTEIDQILWTFVSWLWQEHSLEQEEKCVDQTHSGIKPEKQNHICDLKKINMHKGPFKYYVSKEVGGWGWPNADVSCQGGWVGAAKC